MINYTKEELEFLKKYGIDPQKLKTRWEWVDEEKALAFYRDVIYPHFNSTPKVHDIENLGYRGFLNALKKTRKKHNDYITNLGLKPNFEEKYVGKSFKDLVRLFLDVIYPDLREKLSLEDNLPPTKEEVDNNGYRGFTDNLRKLNYYYGDLLIAAGFKAFRKYRYKGKSLQDLINMFKNQIYPDLIRKKIIKKETLPTKEDLKSNGYSGFFPAIKRFGKTWTYILKKAGFNPKYEHLYNNKSYKQLINIFKNKIYPNIKKVYSLKEEEGPLYDHIEKHYRGFLQALTRVNKKYSELLLDAGFEQNYGKYSSICNLKDLVRIFKEEIYPDVLEKCKSINIVLERKTPPTVKILRDLGYQNFLGKVYDICSYNELLKATGYQPKYEYKYKDMSYENLKELFIYEIYQEINIKLAFKENEAPNTDELREFGYSGFIDALHRNGKTYTELINEVGLEPRQKLERLVGIKLHPIIELLFMKFTKQYNCRSYYEISPNLSSLKRVDNSILRDSNFKNFIESRQRIIQLPEIIRIINIDYTLGSRRKLISTKLNKGYQGKETFLIIVYLGTSKKPIQIPNEIPYRKHVIILNRNKFAQFLGYSGKILNKYNRIVKLAQDACFNPQAFEQLKYLSKKAKRKLKKYSNQQKEYNTYIKREGLKSLLTEPLSDINLDKWLNEKAENRVQKEEYIKKS